MLHFSCQLNLLHYAEIVPTLSTQLNIIASVKAATPNDETVYPLHDHYSLCDEFANLNEYCIKILAKTVDIARKYRMLMCLTSVSDNKGPVALSFVLAYSSDRFCLLRHDYSQRLSLHQNYGYVYTAPVQFSSATFSLRIKCVYTVPLPYPVYTVPDPFDFLLRACAQQVSHCMQGRKFTLKSRQNIFNVCLRKRRQLEYVPHIELQCTRCESVLVLLRFQASTLRRYAMDPYRIKNSPLS